MSCDSSPSSDTARPGAPLDVGLVGEIGGTGRARFGGGPTGNDVGGGAAAGVTRSGICRASSCGRWGRVGLNGGVGADEDELLTVVAAAPEAVAWLATAAISCRRDELAVVDPDAAQLLMLERGPEDAVDGGMGRP